jgi:hypothetical protein
MAERRVCGWYSATRAAGARVWRRLLAAAENPPDADRANEDPGAQLSRAVGVAIALGLLLALLEFLGQFRF